MTLGFICFYYNIITITDQGFITTFRPLITVSVTTRRLCRKVDPWSVIVIPSRSCEAGPGRAPSELSFKACLETAFWGGPHGPFGAVWQRRQGKFAWACKACLASGLVANLPWRLLSQSPFTKWTYFETTPPQTPSWGPLVGCFAWTRLWRVQAKGT